MHFPNSHIFCHVRKLKLIEDFMVLFVGGRFSRLELFVQDCLKEQDVRTTTYWRGL